jgi:hypothetical protein
VILSVRKEEITRSAQRTTRTARSKLRSGSERSTGAQRRAVLPVDDEEERVAPPKAMVKAPLRKGGVNKEKSKKKRRAGVVDADGSGDGAVDDGSKEEEGKMDVGISDDEGDGVLSGMNADEQLQYALAVSASEVEAFSRPASSSSSSSSSSLASSSGTGREQRKSAKTAKFCMENNISRRELGS